MISDTHGDLHTTKKALESQPTAEVIIHCGDSRDELDYIERTVRNKAVIAVKGNCDFGSQLPLEEVRPIGGKRFLICHGHMYNVKYGLQNLEYAAREKQADKVAELVEKTHYPIILCGDINDVPVSYTYSTLASDKLTDAFTEKGRGYGHTFNEGNIKFRIDDIMHSKQLYVKKYVRDKVPYSDHYPIITELAWNKQ